MINLDPQEIAKFSQLATQWWDRDGSFKSLHDINPLRLSFIQKRVTLANKKVLDIGCGGGILSESLAQCGAQVTAIDMSADVLNAARLHQEQNPLGIDYRQIPAEEMALLHPAEFDVVTCMELLEHVPDPASLVKACSTLVKPGGAVFFSTINRNPKAYLFAVVGAEYLLNLLPKGTHDYAKFIRPSELTQWARDTHLTMQALQGMSYQLLTKQYYLTDDISVNYLAYCEKQPL
jgi:2-polyprenyl-6-hydroxyphenyl methylase/3-demethylubiquinone-9 3-methyltransferase